VPGAMNAFFAWSMRLLPRSLQAALAEISMR
jgi:hypothetical protein